MRPILITGGAGSVGRQLAGMFLAEGRPVRIFDLPFMDFSGLEEEPNVEVVKGDITEKAAVEKAVDSVGGVLHLAALLPPTSERDRDKTFAVNVEGTRNISESLKSQQSSATLVFTSSISTYGDTSKEPDPIKINQPQNAIDIYAESKIAGEQILIGSGVNYVILRIASIAVPGFLEPPEPWPFTFDQRVEMVHRDDVADAIKSAVDTEEAVGNVFNIAGGSTWRLTGRDYVRDFFNFMGAPVEMAIFREKPGWNDWYDTAQSQKILNYQNRSYAYYSGEMKAIVEEMMAE
ncbi:MAG: Nucleoside-diphosphate-sugar epimerase [Chloroflexi bacterium]|nr:MAG: Nucleoside-diphosphate-sugar epimerase [Chloroflexota bacterium]